MSGRYEAQLSRVFSAPRSLVWAIVSDTNRWDRAAGLAPPRYSWFRDEDRLLRKASASELGFTLEWLEPPYRWIEGRFVEAERRFVKGPAHRGGFSVKLEDVPAEGTTGARTRAEAIAWVEGPFWVGMIQRPKFASALRRYLDAIQQVVDRATEEEASNDEPAVIRARRVLTRTYEPVASGARTPVDEPILASKIAALSAAPIDPKVTERIVQWVRERPDEEVGQMRPFELAKLWGLDRREVLRGFLHATHVGIVELSWQINCPICRVGAKLVGELGALDGKSHCGACEIDYEVDFAQHVEAIFPVSPAVRRAAPALYCASSPAFLPHVLAQLRVEPGATREDAMDLPLGGLHLRTLWTARAADVATDRVPATLRVTIGDAGIEVVAEGTARTGATQVLTHNATPRESVLLIERSAWSADSVLGTAIASMPEFVNLFAVQAPAAGVELTVGHLALLFSDLTGSTAMYERIGDAKAFAVVEEHFRLMEQVIARHGGAIIKTMGDAVMASFATARDAVAAGLEMIAVHDAKFGEMELGVKLGVHAGPCLAVRANDRLDYFGTTVNLAARLQAQARSSELVIAETLAREPPIHALIAELPARPFRAHLKGIHEEQKLLALGGQAVERARTLLARSA